MKSIKFLIEALPEPYKTKAIKNTHKSVDQQKLVSNLEEAIYTSFDTEESPEGFRFWYDVICSYGAWPSDLRDKKPPLDLAAEEFAESIVKKVLDFDLWAQLMISYKKAYYFGLKEEFGNYETCNTLEPIKTQGLLHVSPDDQAHRMITTERLTSIARGFDAKHDDQYSEEQLNTTAILILADGSKLEPLLKGVQWPISDYPDKRGKLDTVRNKIIAGQFVAAEADRLIRIATPKKESEVVNEN